MKKNDETPRLVDMTFDTHSVTLAFDNGISTTIRRGSLELPPPSNSYAAEIGKRCLNELPQEDKEE